MPTPWAPGGMVRDDNCGCSVDGRTSHTPSVWRGTFSLLTLSLTPHLCTGCRTHVVGCVRPERRTQGARALVTGDGVGS